MDGSQTWTLFLAQSLSTYCWCLFGWRWLSRLMIVRKIDLLIIQSEIALFSLSVGELSILWKCLLDLNTGTNCAFLFLFFQTHLFLELFVFTINNLGQLFFSLDCWQIPGEVFIRINWWWSKLIVISIGCLIQWKRWRGY